MKKNFLYTALGLMGILGTLSMGVVDASIYSVIRPNVSEDTVTVTYNANNGAFSGNSTTKSVEYYKNANDLYVASGNTQAPERDGYMFAGWYTAGGEASTQTTEWYGIPTDTTETTKTVYAKWLPYTNKTVDLGEIGSFDIMDRNLGAAVSGTGNNENAYGFYYQWGNNYGFKNSGSVPYSVTTQIDITGKGYGPGNYYSSATFVKRTSSPYRWDTDTSSTTYTSYGNLNLWGGENTSNLDSWRQGPCPENYHVPDSLEWKAAYNLFMSWVNTVGSGYCNTFGNTSTAKPKCFAAKLGLPFAGYRSNSSAGVSNQGTTGRYWSSSRSNVDYAYDLYFYSTALYALDTNYRANGFSVRCFKNSSTKALTFSRNGEIIDTKNVRRWEPITTSYKPATPSGTTENWYTDSGLTSQFTFGNTTYVTEAKTLYSKITCDNPSYIWNGTECAQPNNTVTFNYEANGGTAATSGSVEVISGNTLNLALYTGTKANWTFVGWNTDSGATEAMVNPTVTEPMTLYAIFKKNLTATFTSNNANIAGNQTSGACTLYNTDTSCSITLPSITCDTGYHTPTRSPEILENITADTGATASCTVNIHKLNFIVDDKVIQSGDVAYGTGISAPANPNKECNSFAGWTSSVEGLTTTGTMPDSDVTFTANWNYTCSKSSGGGGRSRSSTANTQDSSTSSQNDEKTPDSSEKTQNDKNTENVIQSETKGSEESSNTPMDSSANASEGQYSEEFQKAYTFAKEKSITTMDTIEDANMEKPLTRIAMAKMLSYYAINVLNKEPDTNRKIKFRDVSEKLDAQYDHGVTLAYQLGIMGINMKNNKFRPNDLVTRAEFATALSRLLFGIEDGKDNYYSTHLAKLMEEGIIANDNPTLQELRGYVMIMLMRSAENQ